MQEWYHVDILLNCKRAIIGANFYQIVFSVFIANYSHSLFIRQNVLIGSIANNKRQMVGETEQ